MVQRHRTYGVYHLQASCCNSLASDQTTRVPGWTGPEIDWTQNSHFCRLDECMKPVYVLHAVRHEIPGHSGPVSSGPIGPRQHSFGGGLGLQCVWRAVRGLPAGQAHSIKHSDGSGPGTDTLSPGIGRRLHPCRWRRVSPEQSLATECCSVAR